MSQSSSPSLAHGRRAGRPAWVQKGFTLVELMISMVIGLFIVLALLTLLINVNRNNSELTKTNRVIENGRFALQLLQADVSHAGFWGGYMPAYDDLANSAASNDVPTGIPDPCLAYASWDTAYRNNLIGIGIQSYAIGTTTIPVCASKVVSPKANSDVLIVRHAEPCIAGPTKDVGCTDAATSPTEVFFQAQNCTNPSAAGYVTMTYVIGTTATTAFGGTKRDCVTPANTYKLVSNLYYVRDYAVTAGDGVPTLMRSQFSGGVQQPAEPMIEGIEAIRVELGVDDVSDSGATLTTATFNTGTGAGQQITWANPDILTSPTNRGDGIPDNYVRCANASWCTTFQLMNAVAVKIYVLVRSEKKTADYVTDKTYCLSAVCATAADRMGPFTDGYKRHLFTQTVRMVNVSARRETPP